MTHISIGDVGYRILAAEQDGQWIARAERDDSSRPFDTAQGRPFDSAQGRPFDSAQGRTFGIACSGSTQASAIDRLTRWLEWQSAHAAALDALQLAERTYHRTIADGAFVDPADGPKARARQKASLSAVDSARSRLDELRTRQPVSK